MKKTTDSITLRFYDPATLERIDNAASGLSMSRSDFIRRCVVRELQHTEEFELPLLQHREILKALAR
jgi:uncharacterized protein (DUF1778 family)